MVAFLVVEGGLPVLQDDRHGQLHLIFRNNIQNNSAQGQDELDGLAGVWILKCQRLLGKLFVLHRQRLVGPHCTQTQCNGRLQLQNAATITPMTQFHV